MYKDIHCSAISEKSQNSAPSKNILTDPLSPDSSNLMNGHDACTISFYLMGEKKTFPSSGPKQKIQILRLMKASPSKHNALLGIAQKRSEFGIQETGLTTRVWYLTVLATIRALVWQQMFDCNGDFD